MGGLAILCLDPGKFMFAATCPSTTLLPLLKLGGLFRKSLGGVRGELRLSANLASKLSFNASLLMACTISSPTLILWLRPTPFGVSFPACPLGRTAGGGTLNLPVESYCS